MIVGYRKALNNWARQFRTYIDPERRMFQLQERLFGIFKWGTFKPLPKLDYVLVFRHFYAKCEACTIDDQKDNPYSYFQVSLVHHNNRRIIVHETKNREEALRMADTLAGDLRLRVRNSTADR
ncbi:MAG: hypothetical protein JST26_12460 [Bacteroidetes bacterium]|nr:hypothetical protein [Bacteroidota bacterium]